MKKIRRIFSIIFIFLATLLVASEIPHQLITENPEKEVSTVESKKLKDKAELNIGVRKRTPIEITGFKTTEGKMVYTIPKEDEISESSTYIVIENLEELQRKKGIKLFSKGIDTEVKREQGETVVTVDTEKDAYIVEMNNNKLGRIYKATGERATTNIGTYTIVIDRRLKSGGHSYIFAADGGNTPNIVGKPADDKYYPELINVTSRFTNLKSVNIVASGVQIEDRPAAPDSSVVYVDYKGRNHVGKVPTGSTHFKDVALVPVDFNLSDINNRVIVSKYITDSNDEMRYNRFTIKDSSGNSYKGVIEQQFAGSSAVTSTATLTIKKGTASKKWGAWGSSSTGGVAEKHSEDINSGDFKLEFSGSKKQLFDFKSLKNSSKHIVNKIKVTDVKNKKEYTAEGDANGDKFFRVEIGNEYRLGFSKEGFYVTKLDDVAEDREFEIEGYITTH